MKNPVYEHIDDLIVAAVRQRRSPLYARDVTKESTRLEWLTGRPAFRITDGRLQALRKRGVIEYRTKKATGGKAGWYLVSGKESNHE